MNQENFEDYKRKTISSHSKSDKNKFRYNNNYKIKYEEKKDEDQPQLQEYNSSKTQYNIDQEENNNKKQYKQNDRYNDKFNTKDKRDNQRIEYTNDYRQGLNQTRQTNEDYNRYNKNKSTRDDYYEDQQNRYQNNKNTKMEDRNIDRQRYNQYENRNNHQQQRQGGDDRQLYDKNQKYRNNKNSNQYQQKEVKQQQRSYQEDNIKLNSQSTKYEQENTRSNRYNKNCQEREETKKQVEEQRINVNQKWKTQKLNSSSEDSEQQEQNQYDNQKQAVCCFDSEGSFDNSYSSKEESKNGEYDSDEIKDINNKKNMQGNKTKKKYNIAEENYPDMKVFIFEQFEKQQKRVKEIKLEIAQKEKNYVSGVINEQDVLQKKLEEMQQQEQEFRRQFELIQKLYKNQEEIERKIQIEAKKFAAGLPMYIYRKQILDAIQKNPIVVIVGETGSGKSTQIPQFLYEYMISPENSSKIKKIVCTQPRKLATTQVAKRVAEELKCILGKEVGFLAGTYAKHDIQQTKLFFCMDKNLIEEFAVDRSLSKYSYIIIDEAHERNLYTDLLLALVKEAVDLRQDLRVIVTSATLDKNLFKEYFKCPVIEVPGRVFPVELIYSPPLGGEGAGQSDYIQHTIQVIYQILKQQKLNSTQLNSIENNKQGHILVFTTGVDDINKLQNQLTKALKDNDEYLILPLHGRLEPKEQQQVFEESNLIKIILCTRIAETSLTINGVSHVIDPGIDKEMVYNKSKKITLMQEVQITKSQAKQRMGRAGRTQSGKCYRLYSEEFYEKMQDFKKPDIQRLSLDFVVLKLISLGFTEVEKFNFITKPEISDILESYDSLIGINAVIEDEINKKKKVTEEGRLMVNLPTEPNLSRILIESVKYNIDVEIIGIISIITYSSNLFYRGENDKQSEEIKQQKIYFFDESGDLMSFYKIWQFILSSINSNKLKNATKQYKLRYGNIKKIIDISEEIMEGMQKIKDKILQYNVKLSMQEMINRCFLSAYYKNIGLYSGSENIGYTILNQNINAKVYGSSFLHISNSKPEWVIALDLNQGKAGHNFARIIQSIPLDLIKKVTPKQYIDKYNINNLSIRPIYNSIKFDKLSSSILQTFQGSTEEDPINNIIQQTGLSLFAEFDFKKELMIIITSDDIYRVQTEINKQIQIYQQRYSDEKDEINLIGQTRILIGAGATTYQILIHGEYISLYFEGFNNNTRIYTIQEIKDFFNQFKKVGNLQILNTLQQDNDQQQQQQFIKGIVTFETKEQDNKLFQQILDRGNDIIQKLEKKTLGVQRKIIPQTRLKVTWYEGISRGEATVVFKDRDCAKHIIEYSLMFPQQIGIDPKKRFNIGLNDGPIIVEYSKMNDKKKLQLKDLAENTTDEQIYDCISQHTNIQYNDIEAIRIDNEGNGEIIFNELQCAERVYEYCKKNYYKMKINSQKIRVEYGRKNDELVILLNNLNPKITEKDIKAYFYYVFKIKEEINKILIQRYHTLDSWLTTTKADLFEEWYSVNKDDEFKDETMHSYIKDEEKTTSKNQIQTNVKRAILSFNNPKTAQKIFQEYNNKEGVLGSQKIVIEKDMSSRLNIPTEKYLDNRFKQLFLEECKRIQEKYKEVRIMQPRLKDKNKDNQQNKMVSIFIEGDVIVPIRLAQECLYDFVNGKIIKFQESELNYTITHKKNQNEVKKLANKLNVYISFNQKKIVQLKVIGPQDRVSSFEQELKKFAKEKAEMKNIIGLKDKNLQELIKDNKKILKELCKKHNECNIDLSLTKRSLQIIGYPKDVQAFLEDFNKIVVDNTTNKHSQQQQDECPICKLDFQETTIQLYKLQVCGHKYCFVCIKTVCQQGLEDIRQIPIRCPVENCGKCICIKDLKYLFTSQEIQKIYLLSFKKYVGTQKHLYFQCRVCDNVIPKQDEAQDYLCEGCMQQYCTKCGRFTHQPYLCEYYDLWLNDDKARDAIKLLGNCAECPECKALVERDGGCYKMICILCQTPFCYICSQDLTNSEAPYDHVNLCLQKLNNAK